MFAFLAIILFYFRKGDVYDCVVLAAFFGGFGGDLKGGDLGIPSGAPTSWKDAKLIRPEGLKLCVFFLMPRDDIESPGPKTLNCESLPAIFDGLCNGDLYNYKVPFIPNYFGYPVLLTSGGVFFSIL